MLIEMLAGLAPKLLTRTREAAEASAASAAYTKAFMMSGLDVMGTGNGEKDRLNSF